MNSNTKILILYANYGEGHFQVSQALLRHFQENGLMNVQILDLYAEAHPRIHSITQYIYMKSTAYMPFIYGWSYYLTYHLSHDQPFMKWLNKLCIRKLEEVIAQEKPDIVINTFPNLTMSEWRLRSGDSIPIYTVLTDFALHNRWIHSETDKYYVATDNLKHQLIAEGVNEKKICASGIPIRTAFHHELNKPKLMQRYGLNAAHQYILIMAGAYGVHSHLQKMIRILLTVEHIHMLVVCGRDQELYDKIKATFLNESRVVLFGYVEQIEQLMTVSACMITKAGGVTLAEALALQLPVVVYRPVSGQEYENAQYLSDIGAVIIAEHLAELKFRIEQLLSASWEMKRIKWAMSTIQKPAAAAEVVADVLHELDSRNSRQEETRNVPVRDLQKGLVVHDYNSY